MRWQKSARIVMAHRGRGGLRRRRGHAQTPRTDGLRHVARFAPIPRAVVESTGGTSMRFKSGHEDVRVEYRASAHLPGRHDEADRREGIHRRPRRRPIVRRDRQGRRRRQGRVGREPERRREARRERRVHGAHRARVVRQAGRRGSGAGSDRVLPREAVGLRAWHDVRQEHRHAHHSRQGGRAHGARTRRGAAGPT